MVMNAAGQMIDKWWQRVPEKFPNARLDVYQIMPHHFHAIIAITNAQNMVGVDQRVSPDEEAALLRAHTWVRPNRILNQKLHPDPP